MGEPARKLDIELPVHEVEWVLERAQLEGRTISEVLLEAVQELRRHRAWDGFREAALDGQVPLTPEELAAAERDLRG